MSWTDINAFMDRFHTVERQLGLFHDTIDGELWWDSVRFDVCYYLYGCLTGLPRCPAAAGQGRRRALGILRRAVSRRWLLVRARFMRNEVMVVRAPRNIVAGRLRDVVLDPILEAVVTRGPRIDTAPRRYHLPEPDPVRWPGSVPADLSELIRTLLDTFGVGTVHASELEEVIRRVRSDYSREVAGYRRLFAAARPKAVLLVRNGLEKALFHVAHEHGVPTVEVQHGLIGHGHPAYSYARDIDYSQQIGLPTMFMAFSDFWYQNCHYPVKQRAVIGANHFAAGIAPLLDPVGAVMVIAADAYHLELVEITRFAARALPDRKFIYKLHPNQKPEEYAARAAFCDLPNVEIGDPLTPAAQLIDEVSHIVAIQSTVVYEALQQGRHICILPRHDYHIHADIFDLRSVSIPQTNDALVDALKTPADMRRSEQPIFFEAFDADRARALLECLVEAEAESLRR